MFIEKKIYPKYKKDGTLSQVTKTHYVMQCDYCNKLYEISFNPNDKLSFCNQKCYIATRKEKNNIVKQKTINNNIAKHGVEHPMMLETTIEKRKQNTLEKYGVDNVAKLDTVKSKKEQTNLKKYGVKVTLLALEVKEKSKKTNLEKYGTEYAIESVEIKDKIKNIMLEKHGVEHAMQSKIIKDKAKESLLKNFGVEFPGQSEVIRNKTTEATINKYGFDFSNILKNENINDKKSKTMIKKYGVEHLWEDPEYIKQRNEKCILKYGVENYRNSKEYIENIDWKEIFRKAHATKKKNGSYGTSKEEESIYNILLKTFNQDIERQKLFNNWDVDFYIPSLNLYINYNGAYYHGLDRPYEVIKNSGYKTDQNILKTIERDKQKVLYFAEHNIPYLVLLDEDLKCEDPETKILYKIFSYITTFIQNTD